MDFRKIVVLGAGESGVGAALLAKSRGIDVFVSDSNLIKPKYKEELIFHNIAFEERGHDFSAISKASHIIKSPGIPDSVPILKQLKEFKIPIISETEFAWYFSKATFIGVTGSNGKTTTANLITHILQKGGKDAVLCGNAGISLARIISEKDHEIFVVEISSFQLDCMYNFRFHIGILLNITPDHMDRYNHSMKDYAASKWRITQNQKPEDFFIYNADDAEIQKLLESEQLQSQAIPFSLEKKTDQGGYTENSHLFININKTSFIMTLEKLALQGKHNTYDSLAAGISGRLLDIRKSVLKESLSDFQNIEHRLESVAKVHGIEFINDSKATNVNSTWYALESMNRPTIWIAGGMDKGNDYQSLKELAKEKVKALICLGNNNEKLKEAFSDIIPQIFETNDMLMAVQTAYSLGDNGDVVLLSPTCASFDLFENFEDRGKQFKMAIREL